MLGSVGNEVFRRKYWLSKTSVSLSPVVSNNFSLVERRVMVKPKGEVV